MIFTTILLQRWPDTLDLTRKQQKRHLELYLDAQIHAIKVSLCRHLYPGAAAQEGKKKYAILFSYGLFEVLLHPLITRHSFYLKKSDNRLNKRKSTKILSSNAAFQFICMKITMRSFPLANLTSLPLLVPSLVPRGRNMLD